MIALSNVAHGPQGLEVGLGGVRHLRVKGLPQRPGEAIELGPEGVFVTGARARRELGLLAWIRGEVEELVLVSRPS